MAGSVSMGENRSKPNTMWPSLAPPLMRLMAWLAGTPGGYSCNCSSTARTGSLLRQFHRLNSLRRRRLPPSPGKMQSRLKGIRPASCRRYPSWVCFGFHQAHWVPVVPGTMVKFNTLRVEWQRVHLSSSIPTPRLRAALIPWLVLVPGQFHGSESFLRRVPLHVFNGVGVGAWVQTLWWQGRGLKTNGYWRWA